MFTLKHRNVQITRENFDSKFEFFGINSLEMSDTVEGITSKVNDNFDYAYQYAVTGLEPINEAILNSDKEVEIKIQKGVLIISNDDMKQVIRSCSVKIESLVESYKKLGFEPTSNIESRFELSKVKGKFFFNKSEHLSLKNRIEGYEKLVNKKVTIAYFNADLNRIELATLTNASLEEIFLLKMAMDVSCCHDDNQLRIYKFILENESEDITNEELQKLICAQLNSTEEDISTHYNMIVH